MPLIRTFGSVPLVLIVNTILSPSFEAARNCIMWPDDNGNLGLYVGGFVLS